MILLVYISDDDNACQMPSLLQKFLNFSQIKFVAAFETILLDSPYSDNIISHVLLGYLHWIPLLVLQ